MEYYFCIINILIIFVKLQKRLIRVYLFKTNNILLLICIDAKKNGLGTHIPKFHAKSEPQTCVI